MKFKTKKIIAIVLAVLIYATLITALVYFKAGWFPVVLALYFAFCKISALAYAEEGDRGDSGGSMLYGFWNHLMSYI